MSNEDTIRAYISLWTQTLNFEQRGDGKKNSATEN